MKSSRPDTFQANFCAERLKALGDPLRLRIIDVLRHGEMAVSDIAAFLEVTVVNVSHHLQILKHVDLVETRRDGKYIYYHLHQDLKARNNSPTQNIDLGCCQLQIPKHHS